MLYFLGESPKSIFCAKTIDLIRQFEASLQVAEKDVNRYIVAVSLAEAETLR